MNEIAQKRKDVKGTTVSIGIKAITGMKDSVDTKYIMDTKEYMNSLRICICLRFTS